MKKFAIILTGIITAILIAVVVIANIALEMAVHPENNKTRDIETCFE